MLSYSVLFCCAAILAVSSALPTGAPDVACVSMTPAGPHTQNAMEQTTPNPWMIDISAFNTSGNGTVYIPGQTYNSKLAWYCYIANDTSDTYMNIVCTQLPNSHLSPRGSRF